MTEVTPDLGYNVLNVIIELNDVELNGEYEAVNSKQLEMLSITHYGNLEWDFIVFYSIFMSLIFFFFSIKELQLKTLKLLEELV